MSAPAIDWQWGEVDARNEPDGVSLTHRRQGAQLLIRGGRLIRGKGYGAAPASARRDLARVGAIVRLREQMRYLLHASGAVDPLGRAWLLSGDSGSGKSTLAYALARRGWTVLGDDGVVVEIVHGAVQALPWRDPLMVSKTLEEAFPELDGSQAAADPADPRRRAPVPVAAASRSPIAALVFLHRADQFSMQRIPSVEALAALVRQSPWVILNDRHSSFHLAALTRVAGLPAFRLGHTPAELHGMADVLGSALS